MGGVFELFGVGVEISINWAAFHLLTFLVGFVTVMMPVMCYLDAVL